MLYRTLALSNHWSCRLLRHCRRTVLNFSVPSPKVVSYPLLAIFLMVRSIYYFVARVFFCEPFFKAYCTRYGRNLHTGPFFHWVQGRGELIVGDNVTIDGKCSFGFAARFSDRPTLLIGDNTGIGHNSSFTVGKRITIGRDCRIADGVRFFDSPGHPLDPVLRREGIPAGEDEVRPIVIEDNVWIGSGAVIMPGVSVGSGSVVSAGSVVMSAVPSGVLVAGNPARQLRAVASPGVTGAKT